MSSDSQKRAEGISRRDFIKIGAAGVAVIGQGIACSGQKGAGGGEAIIPRRKLGNTDMVTSIIGMGGGSALGMVKDTEQAVALIDLARRKGINFFDSSANYGRSEGRFGRALEPYRSEVYLSSKYEIDDEPDEVMKQFERSLKRFRTDYLDVAHIHSLTSMDKVELMFSSGVLETLAKLKEEGAVRYIGVTSHNNPPAMKAAIERFDFDICFQAANASKTPFIFEFEPLPDSSFEELSLPVALEKGMGVFAFKITGQRRLIRKADEPDKAPADQLIRYGLSLPTHGILLGMSTPEHVTSAAELAANFKPMTKQEMLEWNRRLGPSANELTLHYLNPEYADDGGWRAHLA